MDDKVKKLDFVKSNPHIAAVLSKGVKPRLSRGIEISDKRSYFNINHSSIQSISDKQKERISENEDILDLFPDILLAKQIIVSSILAPKDMFSAEVIYKNVASIIPSSIQAKINDVIKSELDGYYNFKANLSRILEDALFNTGSYISLVIPEASVDQLINGGQRYSTESFVRSVLDESGKAKGLGILGPAVSSSRNDLSALESFFNKDKVVVGNNYVTLDSKKYICIKSANKETGEVSEVKLNLFKENTSTEGFLEFTDNLQILKLPSTIKEIVSERIKNAVKPKVAVEASISNKQFKDKVYKNIQGSSNTFAVLPYGENLIRRSIGRGLKLKLPSECIVPVYPPGDPSNHRGYFVLIDAEGNFVNKGSIDTSPQGLQGLMNANNNSGLTGSLLDKAKNNLIDHKNISYIDNMLEIYGSIVENEMVSRLKNGVYNAELAVSKDKEWDRIMLARALAGKMTRVLYIPKEFVTYYAFDFHKNGVGKSYLDQIRILTSLRGILLFSKIMAEMKNAINVTNVDVTFDPSDPDPQKTIEQATHDIARMREAYFPIGISSPADIAEWIQRAGIKISFSGHPGLPETKFEFSNGNMDHRVPDSQTSEDLRKQTFMAFGLSPEQVDEGYSADFATTIMQRNLLFAKQIAILSDRFSELMTNDVINICTNDTLISEKIKQILDDAGDDLYKNLTDIEKEQKEKDVGTYKKILLERVIGNIWVDLPKPDTSSVTNKATEYKDFAEYVDEILTPIISSEVFPEIVGGEFSGHADEFKAFWKNFILRKWITENNALPDVSEIFKRDEDGKAVNDVYDIMDSYHKEILLGASKMLAKLKSAREAMDKDMKSLEIGEGSSTADSGSSDSGSETPPDTEDGGDEGGGGEGDGDLPDFGGGF